MGINPRRRLFCLLIPIAVSTAAAQESTSEAIRILQRSFEAPTVPYEGRLTVTQSHGDRSRTEDVLVSYHPPDQYQFKFIAPDGSVQKIIQTDAQAERVWYPKNGKLFCGPSIKESEKQLSPDQEMSLLLRNYDVSTLGVRPTIGRQAWILKIQPKVAGKPYKELLVDQETNVILENKKYRPRDAFEVVSRFFEFRPAETSDELPWDNLPATRVIDHDLAPDFMSPREWEQATGERFRFPKELPQGFAFESIDFYVLNKGRKVHHVRYTDGMNVVSLFETKTPVRWPASDAIAPKKKLKPDFIHVTLPEHVYYWNQKNRFFTLVSDLSDGLLKDLSAAFK